MSPLTCHHLSHLLCKFINLTCLSIDFNPNQLSDELIRSEMFAKNLRVLNLNVNTLKLVVLNEAQKVARANAWMNACERNRALRVMSAF